MSKYAVVGVSALGVVTAALVVAALIPTTPPTVSAEPRPTFSVTATPTPEPAATVDSANLETAMAKLDDPTAAWALTVIGDSTGNDGDEWVASLARTIAEEKGRPVAYRSWDPATATYSEPAIYGYGSAAPVEIWNGSASGLGPDYSLANLPALTPAASDVLIVNHGHNFNNPQQGAADVAKVITETAAVWGTTPAVAVTLQNPRITRGSAQDANLAALSSAFDSSSYTLVDVADAYRAEPDLAALLQADGTHPNANGQAIWFATVYSALGL